MKKKFLIPLLVMPFIFSSCGGDDFFTIPNRRESIGVIMNYDEVTIAVGGSVTLTATDLNGKSDGIQWRMDRYDIVTMNTIANSSSATFAGVMTGDVTVTVIIGNNFKQCVIHVTGGGNEQSQAEIKSVELDFNTKVIDYVEGGTNSFVLTANVKSTGFIDTTVTWSSSAENIATVTKVTANTAKVTCLEDGVAYITAKAGNKQDQCKVTINKVTPSGLSISLDTNSLNLNVGDKHTFVATYKGASSVEWTCVPSDVATITTMGELTAVSKGNATVTARVTDDEGNSRIASCNVVVKDPSSPQPSYSWAEPGHLYLHYLRPAGDYDDWCVYMWQKMPNDIGGALFGATKNPLQYPASTRWMNESECGGSGTAIYCDDNGQIVDIDLTATYQDAETGEEVKLIPDETWDDLSKSRIGFLICDQNHMDGKTHWVSDGGSDTWIKKLDQKLPNGKDSILHLFCVQGSVKSYTTEAGVAVEANPTLTDKDGLYSSKNDIANLMSDNYTSGVATSDVFQSKNSDRPGTGYQIFVPSFADGNGDGMGDLRGIINRLDYLERLGIDCLWLTPIQESDSYHGYDVTDYYKIDSKFGTLEDYQELIYKAHQRGMKVLMDMVINHTSKNNVLFNKSEQAKVEQVGDKTIEYRNMYLWKFKDEYVREWDGNIPASSSSPAHYDSVKVQDSEDWYRDGTSDYYYYGKFGSGMAELNYSYQATRDYMTDMCKYWLSFGLDGFRLDAVKHIYLLSELEPSEASKYSDDNQIRYDVSYRTYYDNQLKDTVTAKNDYSYHIGLNVKFWKQFSGAIKSAYPNCFLVGENFDGYNKRIAPFYEALDSQFDFSTYYHLNESTVDGGISNMGGDMQVTLNYNKAERKDHVNGAFTSNHDIARLLNHAAANSTTSHHAEVNPGDTNAVRRAKMFAAVTLLSPGLSWIYYGDEIGMSGNLNNGETGDHGNNTDRWYRQPMRWGTSQDFGNPEGVTKYIFSGLEVTWDNYNSQLATVDQQWNDPNSILNFVAEVCKAKQSDDFPTYGYINNNWGNGDLLCLDIADSESRRVIVTINFSNQDYSIESQNQGALIGCSSGSSATVVKAGGFNVVKK